MASSVPATGSSTEIVIAHPLAHVLTALSCLALSACISLRPGASEVASTREAAARSVAALPPVRYALRVEQPGAGGAEREIPWAEVVGRVGSAELFGADVMLVIDTSASTLRASGMDIDEDGIIGEMRGIVQNVGARASSSQNWTTDRDDTVIRAELEASRSLILGLAPRRNRIGVISYTEKPRVRAELGAPAEALAAIDEIHVRDTTTVTSIAAALREAREKLLQAPAEIPARPRSVLLFTDGRPTVPTNEFLAARSAVLEASYFHEAGIGLYVLAVGPLAAPEAEFLLELAGAGSGRLFRIYDPRRLLNDLPSVDLSARRLEIDNVTSGARAEGLRTSEAGGFDAFVPLLPGANRIRVVAELRDGTLERWEGEVRYAPPEEPSAEQRRAEERVSLELRRRAEAQVPATPAVGGP